MKIRLTIVLRVLGFLLGGGVAVAAALAFFVWVSFSAERTTGVLTQHFKDRYQRTLTLGAPPQLRVWPQPTLLLHKVVLSEAGRSEVFARADEMRLELALLPLLARRHEVRRLLAAGVEMHLARARNGSWNPGLLLEPVDDGPHALWRLNLEQFEIRSVKLRVDDARNAFKFEWQDFSLVAEGMEAGAPARVRWQGQWLDAASGSDFAFKGTARASLDVDAGAGSLSRLNLTLDGNGRGLQGASAELESKRVAWSDWGAQGELDTLALKLQGAAGQQALSLAASAPRLGWQSWRLQGEKAEARLTLRAVGEETEFRLNAPQLGETENGFRSEDISFAWKAQAGKEHGSQGSFRARLEADLRGNAVRVEGLQGEFSVQHPRLHTPAARMAVSGQAQWRAGAGSELQLDGLIGDDTLRLQAQLQQLWPASGRFELTSSRLDVDRLLAEARPGTKLPAPSLPDFGRLTLNGRLKLDDLRIGGLFINSLQAPLVIDKGVLAASGVSASLYGGKLGGELSSDSATGRVNLQGEFSELGLERMILEGKLPILLSGRASGSYKLATVFSAGKQALAELTGAIRWTLAGSGIRGVDLARSLNEFHPAILAGKQAARTPAEIETTEIGTAASRFVFAGGKLQAENVQSRNSWLTLAGSGTADLLREELDFRLQASLLPGVATLGNKNLLELRGKPLALHLKGPLRHPDVRYEPAGVKK